MKNKAAIFSNERTVASAGAGKTYALTNRFIALSRRCPPEDICALTFTRMAAGEFLDKILTKLASAVLNRRYADYLAQEISELSGEKVSPKEFFELLKKIVAALPKLSLLTIDSFEMRFASAFAAELGMFGEARIMDEFQEARAKRKVLKLVLSAFASDKALFDSFSTAVEAANGGKLEKDVSKSILSFIEKSQNFYRSFPNLSEWGNFELFESTAGYKGQWNSERYKILLAELMGFDDSNCKPIGHIKTFFKNSTLGSIYKVGTKGTLWLKEYARRRFCGETGANAENAGLVELSLGQLKVVDELLDILMGGTFRMMCNTAKAVGSIVASYDKVYSREIIERGNISFDDLPVILSDSAFAFERSLIEYRLDAKYKHWLLDEFQDTSRSQWKVLENLISEVLSDDSGERTAYYVGDMKQSIYGWRGGDPELFDEIFKSYPNTIRDAKALNESRRSSLPVISAINAIFSPSSIRPFGDAAAEAWGKMWCEHTSHADCGTDGCAAYLEVSDVESKIDAVYGILKEIDPSKRGLECAVLVYKNKQVENIIDGLRARAKKDGFPLPVAGELDCSISDDNMVVPAVLSLLKSAAHPGDTISLAYARMTPLERFTRQPDWRESILSEISSCGFEKFLSRKFMSLKAEGDIRGNFSLARFKNLIDAACEFDAEFSPDIDDFLEFARKYKVRETSKQSSVQVMTVHKSKGLDFDFVILPELGNSESKNSSLRLQKISVGGRETVVSLPSREACGFSEILEAAYGQWAQKLALESICRFYVGATRAKKGLYFIGKPLDAFKKSNSKFSFERLLAELAGPAKSCAFAGCECKVMFGDSGWYLGISENRRIFPKREIGYLQAPKLSHLHNPAEVPSEGVSGSSEKFRYLPGANLSGKAFGSLVHAIFQSFSSTDPIGDLASFAGGNYAQSQMLSEAKRIVGNCLDNPEILALFTAPTEFKNEFPFSAFGGGRLISGVFDRLNFFKDESGCIERLEVVDYKTDALCRDAAELASIYSHQMSMYADCAARLFALDKSKIRVRLVAINSSTIADCAL